MPEKVRRPRIPPELAERIDAERGLVPFEAWVRQALEKALGTREGHPAGEPLRPDGDPPAPPRASEAPEDVQVAAWEAGQASYRDEGAGDYEREPFVD